MTIDEFHYLGRPIATAWQARDAAIHWQHNIADQPMSWSEVAEWGEFFAQLGERFDLTDEFRENGVI